MTDAIALHERYLRAVQERTPVVTVTVIRGDGVGAKLVVLADEVQGTLGDAATDREATDRARALLDEGRSTSVMIGEREVYIESTPSPPTLLIIGAVHAGQALCMFAKAMGFDVIVVDAREKLATRERFPQADQIIVAWPDEAMAQLEVRPNWFIAILTHDPKFDEPAISSALQTPARYIGAIGSRKTSADRRQRLRDLGISDEDLERVRGPIGLDIGAASPEEMAISILGEIIAMRNGRGGGALTHASGSIRGQQG